MSLDNYASLVDPREHVRSSLRLVTEKSNAMCKILPITFKGLTRAWYNNLKPGSIAGFIDLCAKLVTCFSISIPAKQSSMKFFRVT
jgi:hypothetical protein